MLLEKILLTRLMNEIPVYRVGKLEVVEVVIWIKNCTNC